MNAPGRFILVIGIIVLIVAMLGVALAAYAEFSRPLPWSCGDYSGPSSLLPSECHKNIALYLFALVLLGGGVGYLWRKLGR